jgi:hypothetical protein
MKQLLSLFLFLLPCLVLAQYPSNGNQKITLGEQTTADGLIYRGVAADTTLTAKSDTAAYFVLDTVNINLYTYKASATGRKWRQLGADTASFNYVNTYGPQTVNGAKTFTSAVTATRFNPTANTATGTGMYLPASNTLGFSTNSTVKFLISPTGNLSTDSVSKTTSTYKTFELGKSAGTLILAGRNDGFNYLNLGTNYYTEGGSLKYIATSNSSLYEQLLGDHIFNNAPSGSANSNITYTELARITKDGRLGIGTANPSYLVASSSLNGNAFMFSAESQSIGTPGNWVGYLYGFKGNNYQKGATIFESIDGNGRGKFHIALNNASNASNVTISDAKLTVLNDGNVGIGTTTPQSGYRLHVVDSVYVGGNVSASAYTTRSDYNLKDDIFDLKYGLNDVLQLQPVEYTYKSNGSKQLGFIAQDIGTILPEVVSFEESMSVNYQAIIPILTKAIQEQQALIKALEQRIINLENK